GAADEARSAPSDTTTTLNQTVGVRRGSGCPRSGQDGLSQTVTEEYHGKKGSWFRQAADPCRQGESGPSRGYGSRPPGNQHHGLLQRVQRSDAGPGYDSPG